MVVLVNNKQLKNKNLKLIVFFVILIVILLLVLLIKVLSNKNVLYGQSFNSFNINSYSVKSSNTIKLSNNNYDIDFLLLNDLDFESYVLNQYVFSADNINVDISIIYVDNIDTYLKNQYKNSNKISYVVYKDELDSNKFGIHYKKKQFNSYFEEYSIYSKIDNNNYIKLTYNLYNYKFSKSLIKEIKDNFNIVSSEYSDLCSLDEDKYKCYFDISLVENKLELLFDSSKYNVDYSNSNHLNINNGIEIGFIYDVISPEEAFMSSNYYNDKFSREELEFEYAKVVKYSYNDNLYYLVKVNDNYSLIINVNLSKENLDDNIINDFLDFKLS